MAQRNITALASATPPALTPAKRKLTTEERRRVFLEAKAQMFEIHGPMLAALAQR